MPEIEAKLSVTDPSCADAILSLEQVGRLRVAGRREVEIVDRYLDTPERDLAASSGSLRIRLLDGEELYTYKIGELVDGFARRTEVEEPSGGRDLIGWLYWLVDSGRANMEHPPDSFEPVLEIRNRRRILDLADDAGTEVELALDRVRFVGPRGEHEDMEIELELLSGSEEALREAVDWLREQYALQPGRKGKYERGLALVG